MAAIILTTFFNKKHLIMVLPLLVNDIDPLIVTVDSICLDLELLDNFPINKKGCWQLCLLLLQVTQESLVS